MYGTSHAELQDKIQVGKQQIKFKDKLHNTVMATCGTYKRDRGTDVCLREVEVIEVHPPFQNYCPIV